MNITIVISRGDYIKRISRMRKISSDSTNFYKKQFPRLFFIIFGLVSFIFIPEFIMSGIDNIFIIISPVFMAVLVMVIIRIRVSVVDDKVYLGDDFILVDRMMGDVVVKLSDITNLNYSLLFIPPRVLVRYIDNDIEKTIYFIPSSGPGLFKKNKDILDLVHKS